ncbi:reverse transcriptase domain-containing protein, partial [Tanacetum coccineum]
MVGSKRSRDMTKYCNFHEDHGHDTNQCRELSHQIEEAVNSGRLAHLVKGIKKGKAKTSDTQPGEWKKGDKDIVPAKALILMISRESPISKKNSLEGPIDGIGEITFPLVSGSKNSLHSVIIKVHISKRQVNRAYMDSGNTCEVIYEHCFLKLNPSIRALRVDSKILLVGFLGEHSWPLGEVPLEVTIGENPYTKTETLNFIIVRSDSPHNLLLGRTAIQRMGIVVSTIHATIKFNTNKVKEGQKKIKETIPEAKRDVLSCVDAKEKLVVNDKCAQQTGNIGK